MQKATYILGFVFEFKKMGEEFYQPIAGINDRGNIVWSESVYWQQNYLCKAGKTRCPTAYGSVTESECKTWMNLNDSNSIYQPYVLKLYMAKAHG